jgi:hypothetical protein
MKTAPPPTKPGTTKLSDLARKVVAPSGITSTMWPSVRDTCMRKLGIEFDPWQDGAGRLILGKRADGKLAAMIGGVGMSLPRQVGKTYLIGAIIFALCILRPKLLVIWSAHHARTHGETFLAMQAFANRSKVKPYIEAVFKGSGDEEIRFRNGSRILFGARERGFGRGIPGVDVIVSDEAQIMTDKALDAQLATMNTSQFGLAIFVGTPPRPEDPSEAFTRMRDEAWAGTLEDAVWIEFGAEAGADPDVRKNWRTANPSYPHRTPVESMLRLRRKLKTDSFLREGLGIWDDRSGAAAFGAGFWQERAYAEGEGLPAGLPVGGLAVAVAYDLSHAAIGAAALDSDGVLHLKPLAHSVGTDWVVKKAKELQDLHGVMVVIDGKGPGSDLVDDLEQAGIKTHVADTDDVCDAFAELYKRVTTDGTVRHGSFPELDAAVGAAVPRTIGDRKAWGRKTSTADISVLEAETLAAWWAGQYQAPPAPPPQVETSSAPSETYDLSSAGF